MHARLAPTQATRWRPRSVRVATGTIALSLFFTMFGTGTAPAAIPSPAPGHAQVVAGTGATGNTGDNGPASAAKVGLPAGIAVAPDGTIYFGDNDANVVRSITPDGTIHHIAGTGVYANTGDGGASATAAVGEPDAILVAPNGDLYVGVHAGLIRKIDHVTNVITRYAGGGALTTEGAAALSTYFGTIDGMAFDPFGNIVVSDGTRGTVRVINRSTRAVTTLAGTGSNGYSGDGGLATAAKLNIPWGVAYDHSGNLYIADSANNRIRRVDQSTGKISTVAGTGATGSTGDGGPATAAKLNTPYGLSIDQSDRIYFADTVNGVIRSFTVGGTINTVVGGGSHIPGPDKGSTTIQLSYPYAVTVDLGGRLLIGPFGYLIAAGAYSVSPTLRFVNAADLDFLGRTIVLTAAQNLANAIDASSMSKQSFLNALTTSSEWLNALVTNFYMNTLGRAPDSAGLAYWTQRLANGTVTVAQVAANFYASPEYYSGIGGGTDSSWITDLYHKLLNRNPDSSGLAYWQGQIATTSRTSVAYRFFQSLESRQTRVTNLYLKLLHRLPDTTGRDYWAGVVETNGDLALATNLASSPEYAQDALNRWS